MYNFTTTPAMLALIMSTIFNTPFNGKEYGGFFIERKDFQVFMNTRDKSIPEAVFLTDFIECLAKCSLTFSRYGKDDFVVLYVEPGMIGRHVTKKVLDRFSSV